MFVVTLVRIGCSNARKKVRNFVAATMRSPSATSPRSLAALTRDRTFRISNRRSRSVIVAIQGSPTSVSKIVTASDGGIARSDRRLESGFSILRRLFSLLSMSLLLSCSSDIWPDTEERSF